ncbi:hypothetical protein TWF481_003134 [Arthrobotrys musiformis]|uniref:Uncharacterized protein n=1 Tax=Arthrobotrys musiformis TaxID=47236 RepID=A0AAV9VPC8_9PEZI
MPLVPIGHHAYILPGGERVYTHKSSEVLQRITMPKNHSLRKIERERYLMKKRKQLLERWVKELRETTTKYHQCVMHIKELFRLQVTGEPPADKSIILVKRLRLKRSDSYPKLVEAATSSPSPPPPPDSPPPGPMTKTPRPPNRSRIPISTWRKNNKGRLGGRYIDGLKIPKFLKHEGDATYHDYCQPIKPSTHVWSPEPGSRSGRFSRVGLTAKRRPKTAPNQKELLIGLKDEVRRKINFRDN